MSSSVGFNLDISILSHCLTTAQKLAIKNALLKIKLQENLSQIRFWGKINGTTGDYFIAIDTNVSTAIEKKFYWSNDEGVTFAQLPSPDDFVSAKSPKIRGLFTGNPSLKYKDPDAPPRVNEDGEIEESDEEEEEEEDEPIDEDEVDEDGNPIVRQPPPRRLTELERLAFNVREIEHSTGIVPRGAYYITATGEILKNPSFNGLTVDDSRKLSSYYLFRNAEDPSTLASIRKMGVANHSDFLDPLLPKNSKVKHTWSLQVADSGIEVSLRSLLFPGFEYVLEAGSNTYTGGYFGSGEKNEDILFML